MNMRRSTGVLALVADAEGTRRTLEQVHERRDGYPLARAILPAQVVQ